MKNYPLRILRQKVINYYIVDFYCAKANLAIEIDGKQHYSIDGLEYDRQRDTFLEIYGIYTLRIKNEEIDNDFREARKKIDIQVLKQMRYK